MDRITKSQLGELVEALDSFDEYLLSISTDVDSMSKLVMEAVDFAINSGANRSAAAPIKAKTDALVNNINEAVMEIKLYTQDVQDVFDELSSDYMHYEACSKTEARALVEDAADIIRGLGAGVEINELDLDDFESLKRAGQKHEPAEDYGWDIQLPRQCPLRKEGQTDSEFSVDVLEFLTGTVGDLTQMTIELAVALAKANREIDDLTRIVDGAGDSE